MALPSYDSVKGALNVLEALGEASETHALLCALFAGGVKLRKQAWLDSLLNQTVDQSDAVEKDASTVLLRLFDATTEAFANSEMLTVDLLLPGDEVSIHDRIEALSQWTQGFVTGLKLTGMDIENNANESLQESLTDLINISCLDPNEESDEEAENALSELVEYARAAVIHVRQEVQEALVKAKGGSQKNNTTRH